jgi:hypothetical protein
MGGHGFRGFGVASNGVAHIGLAGSGGSKLTPWDIDYHFEISYNPRAGIGWLTGEHDQFPSYVVRVNERTVYDYQQIPGIFGVFYLQGDYDVAVSRSIP